MATFTITVLEKINIVLSSGQPYQQGDVFDLDETQVDQNIYQLWKAGYIASDPDIPEDLQSLAQIDSNLDTDPLYPFIISRLAETEAIAAASASALHVPVNTIPELQAIVAEERADKMAILVEAQGSNFRYDAESTATPDDYFIVKPDDVTLPDPGRWIKYTAGQVNPATHPPVQTVAELRAIPANQRGDKMTILMEDAKAGFRFDAQSVEPDNGQGVIIPDDITHPAPGRWHKYTGVTEKFFSGFTV